MSRYSSKRTAFTLVELLTVIAILGIISGMLAIALAGAQRQAKETRAEGFTDRLNLAILNVYEQESRRIVTSVPNTPRSFDHHNQSLLMWKRDWLRCALPDRKQDLIDPPSEVRYPLSAAAGGGFARLDSGVGSARFERLARYRNRVLRTYQALNPASPPTNWPAAAALWSETNQSSECLYMILASNIINGVPALQTLNDRDIGDTDGDGMPEIIDSWDNPVGFMRWPVGLYLTPDWNSPPSDPAVLAAMKRKLGRDAMDIVYSDPRYMDSSQATPPANHEAQDPFNVYPMVVSAGADGVFDLYGLDPDTSGNPPNISYGTNTLTDNSLIRAGYGNPLPFVDPYLYQTPIAQQLGARTDAAESRINNTSDNVYPSVSFQ